MTPPTNKLTTEVHPHKPLPQFDSFQLGETQAIELFDTSPSNIVEVEATESYQSSDTATNPPTVSTVTFVAKTRTPWLMVIAGGTLVSMACISFFIIGLNTGLKLNQTQPIHYSK